uniref:glycosyltransferase family 4 protein n=1 Tax=Acetivibrio cellulolyticus TaxID=35830 RepID=UPI0003165F7A|nr:glycosyltransferase family 4 protein [Acetivibrio cellulolyticus]
MSKIADVDLVTNYYYPHLKSSYNVYNIFFKFSENMNKGLLRRVLRGYEYWATYRRILKLIRKNNYDIIHIQWLLFYSLDIKLLDKIKKHCKKLVLTAHNAIPHVNGESKVNILQKLYDKFDAIVIHGNFIWEELKKYFKLDDRKIFIQKHGRKYENVKEADPSDLHGIRLQLKERFMTADKIFLFLGNMFYNKGTDRLVNVWLKTQNKNNLLVLAGRKYNDYNELTNLEPLMKERKDIIYLNEFVDNDVVDFLFNSCDCVVLPYRHASMSGVIFSAAGFRKTFLCTDVGSFKEYMIDGKTGFIADNDDNGFEDLLSYIIENIDKQTLQLMGIDNYNFINEICDWDSITRKLYDECYMS